MTTPTTQEGCKSLTALVPVSLHHRLAEAARITCASRASIVRRAIKNEVEKIEREAQDARKQGMA